MASAHECVESFEGEGSAWREFLDKRFNAPTASGQRDGSLPGDGLRFTASRRDRHALPPSVEAQNRADSAREETASEASARGEDAINEEGTTWNEVVGERDEMDPVAEAGTTEVQNFETKRGVGWIVRKRSIAVIRDAIARRVSVGHRAHCTACVANEEDGILGRMISSPEQRSKDVRARRKSLFTGHFFGEKAPQSADAREQSAQVAGAENRKASRPLSEVFVQKARFVAGKFRRRDSGYDKTRMGNSGSESVEALMPQAVQIADPSPENENRWSCKRQESRSREREASSSTTEYSTPVEAEVDVDEEAELSSPDYTTAVEELQPLAACPATQANAAIPAVTDETTAVESQPRHQMPVTQHAQTALTPEHRRKRTPIESANHIGRLASALHHRAAAGHMDGWRTELRFDMIYERLKHDDHVRQRAARREYLAQVASVQREMNREHWEGVREWERMGRPVASSWRYELEPPPPYGANRR